MDCGGGSPVNGVAAFGGSPNNEVVVLCDAELVVDVLAVLGSNKFGVMDTSCFFSLAPSDATSENGKLVVDGFSRTGFPNANGRLDVALLVVVIDAGLSSVELVNENDEGDVFCSSAVFPNEKGSMIGLLSAGGAIVGPLSSLDLPNVNCAGESTEG